MLFPYPDVKHLFCIFRPFNATAGLTHANILEQSIFCPPLRYWRCNLVRKVDVAQIPIVVPSRHAWLTSARAVPPKLGTDAVKNTLWTLLSAGSLVVLVLQAMIQRLKKEADSWPASLHQWLHQRPFCVNAPQRQERSALPFLVVRRSKAVGKWSILENLRKISVHPRQAPRSPASSFASPKLASMLSFTAI